ncbi:adenosylcobinamide-phosphate synthase CbiB [Tranquillimonas alkanivorans]|uniref:Cobalamin biosynthesis protein CobD n=1 Tax=Tranquillimonas alkanivorans TaxID=441119 RepID=A0A1I5KMN1_9RHOB|nr:adenosylcobinamide-phosphate synthase CbiB [Tranquillimonas alkanivorans]SFO86167.1 adenosylcobinamide-phosphate synthase [Tranquillimonas alkanivorans]
MTHAGALALALLIDALLGEPRWVWDRYPHPAVLMGRAVAALDRSLNHGENRKARGVLALASLAVPAWVLGGFFAALPFGWLVEIVAAAILLAQRSLVDHVRDVANALRISLGEGRRAVARIVGRDTAGMDASAVSRAAIESAAENFSDGVIAPAFWFLLLGLPGLLVYKIVNTADSMIGYRTPRYAEFGWASARFDDLLNWVPARLTAALLALAHPSSNAWPVIRRDAGLHRSPNAGWPEAAMAAVLGAALSGPRSYHGEVRDYPYVHPEGRRALGPDDIEAAVRVLWRGWLLTFGIVTALAIA